MAGMKILKLAALTLLCLNSITAAAAPGDLYAWWSSIWGPPDPNAGTTIFPSLEVPLGGRLEGMGTASAAVAHDAGFLEANPAATALLKNTEFAFSHHGWIADTSLEGVVYTVRFDDLGFGFGGRFLYVPFTGYDEWGERASRGTISETVATANVAYNFLRSYSFPGFAAGANIKAAYRHVPADIAYGQSILGLMTDIGMQTSFSFAKLQHWSLPNVSVGLVLKNLGISTMPDESLPLTASAGLAYAPLRALTLAADFNLPLSLDADPAREWDLAFGTSIAVAEFLSLQCGMHLKPGNPRMSIGADIDLGTWSINANYNLDMSALARNPVDKFSVQARLDLGDRGRADRRQSADELYEEGLREFSLGDLEKSIELWREVLVIEPRYTPARQYLAIAEATLETQRAAAAAGTGP
jgi:tetratricopeptide (TPR) repeat protein